MGKHKRERIRWSGGIDFEEAERTLDRIDRSNRSTLPIKAKRQLRKAYAELQAHEGRQHE